MNLPNKITLFRVFMVPIFLITYLSPMFDEPVTTYVSTAIFIIASISDFFDGYLARKYNLVTTFGKFADPLADKVLVCAALVCMVEKGLLAAWFVVLILAREFIISAFRAIAAEKNIIIAANMWGKVKTNFQMIMIIFVMLKFSFTLADMVANALIITTAALTVISGYIYIRDNINVLK